MTKLVRNTSLGCLLLFTILALVLQASAPVLFNEGHKSWLITEWFINYQGGFVRRGLPGEVIFALWQETGIRAQFIAIAISVALFLTLIWMALRQSRDHWPWYVVVSPILMTMPLFGGSLIRKDILGVVVLALCLIVLRRVASPLLATALTSGLVIAMLLSHEAFLFYGVPLVLLAIMTGHAERPVASRTKLLHAGFVLGSALAAAAIVSSVKGNTAIATAINASWLSEWQAIAGTDCCFDEPRGAIGALQWTIETGLAVSPRVLTEYSFGIYVPLAWAVTAVILFLGVAGTFRPTGPGQRSTLVLLLLVHLLCVAPLFVLGWDFGRWLFYWTAGSFFMMCHLLQTLDTATFEKRALSAEPRLRLPVHPALFLVFGVPAAAWTVPNFIEATPLGHMAAAGLQTVETVLGIDIKIFE